jgi:hypothetical protein
MVAGWQLAQMNIATLVADAGDLAVQPFFDALAEVNLLAEASPGFVWRLKDEASDNATSIAVTADPRLIVNMSVWESADTLFDFVYRSAHTPIMARRRQFFVKPADNQTYQVLWWCLPATRPPSAMDWRGSGILTALALRHWPSPSSVASLRRIRLSPQGPQSRDVWRRTPVFSHPRGWGQERVPLDAALRIDGSETTPIRRTRFRWEIHRRH